MVSTKTELLQKKTIKELTGEAVRIRQEFESYVEDLKLYSKADFWQAVNEAEAGNVSTHSSIKAYAQKMAKK
ncbi:MAG: hypothetical protein Q7R47_02675 [Candidatus Diapherotrites archaeon]|nr:hypothetical protein [Candidatus Diapherotrites archaeon]